ncbi:hypothetical protein GCM10010441_09730 [Kitasatospora paracochleata]|uniref:Integral membrane protein n=1 Tax=Kitasatospora paracochleata TaxID=58354 RepID=A0ABT1IXL2_9ACTN|nr:hypothetical protein [Kitasatospora paracochleata]MCP2309873.1 hypothetical protein [Kitasatospora paracochleata]
MAICTYCGAASALGAVRCASCDQPFASVPAIGEVVEETGRGEPGRWGRGVVHEPRTGRLRIDPGWPAALRALLAPTVLLLVTALLLADTADGAGILPEGPFGERYGRWLAVTLTCFGATWRSTTELSHGLGAVSTELELRTVPLVLTVLWLLLLRLGLRRGLRERLRRRPEPPTPREAAGEALRTGLVAGLTTLLLGLLTATELTGAAGSADLSGLGTVRDSSGIVLWQAVAGSALAAAALAFAVHAADVLPPRALAWRSAALLSLRVTATAAAVASVVALVLTAAAGWPVWLDPVAVLNVAMLLIGIGSGARAEVHASGLALPTGAQTQSLSLFDLQGHSAHWCWTVLLALGTAVLLGRTARRHGLGLPGRLRLAAVHAGLTTVLLLGAGVSLSFTTARHGSAASAISTASGGLTALSSTGWSVGSVLVAVALWTALGALGVPALLDLVRPVAAPPAADVPTADGPEAGGVVESAPVPHPASPYRSELLESRGGD